MACELDILGAYCWVDLRHGQDDLVHGLIAI
jgi:hypothetical protein